MFSWLRKLFGGSPDTRHPHPEERRAMGPAVPIRPRQSTRSRSDESRLAAKPGPKDNPYHALRQQALTTPRPIEEGGAAKTPAGPWAAMMEMGYKGATVTMVAFEDGTASIYFSSGGGFIGGGQHETIRRAGQDFITTAGQFLSEMALTTEYPEPRFGETIFYVRTDAGTYTAKAVEDDLREGAHPLTPLYGAGQEVITQYRLWEEANRK